MLGLNHLMSSNESCEDGKCLAMKQLGDSEIFRNPILFPYIEHLVVLELLDIILAIFCWKTSSFPR